MLKAEIGKVKKENCPGTCRNRAAQDRGDLLTRLTDGLLTEDSMTLVSIVLAEASEEKGELRGLVLVYLINVIRLIGSLKSLEYVLYLRQKLNPENSPESSQ